MMVNSVPVKTTAQVHTESPVFVLGLHRSGTTWLYELLASTGQFDILTACHVICYHEYVARPAGHAIHRSRLHSRFRELGLSSRGGEAIRLSPDTPEEYGFILDNHGAGLRLSRRNLPLFLQLARVVGAGRGEARRLLVKNPWDFSNAGLIKELLPEARFIFIHRNPFHVLSSMYRLITSAVQEPDPYTAMLHQRYRRFQDSRLRQRSARWCVDLLPGMVVRALVSWVRRATAGYLRNLARIPETDRIEITYEALCQHPNASMNQILSNLGVSAGCYDYGEQVSIRALRVPEPVAAKRKLITRALAEYAAATGYDLTELARQL